jgi:hypothetical protein
MGKNQDPDPGSGMNNPDHISESLETIFLDADPGSGMEKIRIRDKHLDLQHCLTNAVLDYITKFLPIRNVCP